MRRLGGMLAYGLNYITKSYGNLLAWIIRLTTKIYTHKHIDEIIKVLFKETKAKS